MITIRNLARHIMDFDYELRVSLSTSMNIFVMSNKNHPYFPLQKLEFLDDKKNIIFGGFSVANKYSTLEGLIQEHEDMKKAKFERVKNDCLANKGFVVNESSPEYVAQWGKSHETVIKLFLKDEDIPIELATHNVLMTHSTRIENLVKSRISYLQSLSKFSEYICDLVRNNVRQINQEAIEEITSVETFVDLNLNEIDLGLRMVNVALLYIQSLPTGRLISDFKYHMQGTAWRYIGGSILEEILDNQVECIGSDIEFFKKRYSKEYLDNMKIDLDSLEEVSSYFRRLSTGVGYMTRKMKRAYDRLYGNWKHIGLYTGFKPDVVGNIIDAYNHQEFVNLFIYADDGIVNTGK